MKNMISLLFIMTMGAAIYGCSDSDYHFDYVAEPKTEIGKKLVEGTELFASIHSDSTYNVTDGVTATEISYLSMKGSAMKIFIFDVDLKNPNVDMKIATPNGSNTYGMQPMTKQATFMDKEGHKVWGGFNADFYNMSTGVPRAVLHRDGVAVKTNFDAGDRGFFAFTDKKKALVGTRDEYPVTSKKLKFQEAVGGGALLLRDSNILPQTDVTIEPRTAVGISADSTKVYVLAVDGRNFSYSNGMQLEELAECLKALGSATALNLDGGGSTTFFVRNTPDFTDGRFEVRNWPTDKGGEERSVANGVVIISKK